MNSKISSINVTIANIQKQQSSMQKSHADESETLATRLEARLQSKADHEGITRVQQQIEEVYRDLDSMKRSNESSRLLKSSEEEETRRALESLRSLLDIETEARQSDSNNLRGYIITKIDDFKRQYASKTIKDSLEEKASEIVSKINQSLLEGLADKVDKADFNRSIDSLQSNFLKLEASPLPLTEF